jgi:hypothetical protein
MKVSVFLLEQVLVGALESRLGPLVNLVRHSLAHVSI